MKQLLKDFDQREAGPSKSQVSGRWKVEETDETTKVEVEQFLEGRRCG